MPNRQKMNFQGREVWGQLIPVTNTQENWNQYILDDGSVVKSKTVVTEIYRIEDFFDPEGNPVYYVKSTNILSVNAPEDLKKKPE